MKIGDRVEKNGQTGTMIQHPRNQPQPPVWKIRVRWDNGTITTHRYGDGDLRYAEEANTKAARATNELNRPGPGRDDDEFSEAEKQQMRDNNFDVGIGY